MNERRPAIFRKRFLCADIESGGFELIEQILASPSRKSEYFSEEAPERVLVWPLQMFGGTFVVEHEDGTCSSAAFDELTFLDSSSEFGKYEWPEMR